MNREIFKTFVRLGEQIRSNSVRVPYKSAQKNNPWFDKKSVDVALAGISRYLARDKLHQWIRKYPVRTKNRTIGLIPAGNIPLVGFHDLLCILMAGYRAAIRPSSKDVPLMRWIIERITKINPDAGKKISLKSDLGKCDGYIATGSDNTIRYFEYEFRGKPSLLRKNRTSVGVLTGDESSEQMEGLAKDIFQYYGLGCRNISFLLIPHNYNLQKLRKATESHQHCLDNSYYKDNYLYYRSILKMGNKRFEDFGNLLVRKNQNIYSGISVLHYSHYKGNAGLKSFIRGNKYNIQCVAGIRGLGISTIAFGTTQTPEVWDYNDGLDTMKFLTNL